MCVNFGACDYDMCQNRCNMNSMFFCARLFCIMNNKEMIFTSSGVITFILVAALTLDSQGTYHTSYNYDIIIAFISFIALFLAGNVLCEIKQSR